MLEYEKDACGASLCTAGEQRSLTGFEKEDGLLLETREIIHKMEIEGKGENVPE